MCLALNVSPRSFPHTCLPKFVGKAAVYRNGTIFVVLFNELGFVCLFLFSSQISIYSLIKGITPKIRMLCFVLINSVLWNLLCV